MAFRSYFHFYLLIFLPDNEQIIQNMAEDIFDKIHVYFREHPKVMALIPLSLGVMMIVGAVQNWDWLYAPSGTFRGIGGISAYFGRTIARIVGVVVGLIFFFVAYIMFNVTKW